MILQHGFLDIPLIISTKKYDLQCVYSTLKLRSLGYSIQDNQNILLLAKISTRSSLTLLVSGTALSIFHSLFHLLAKLSLWKWVLLLFPFRSWGERMQRLDYSAKFMQLWVFVSKTHVLSHQTAEWRKGKVGIPAHHLSAVFLPQALCILICRLVTSHIHEVSGVVAFRLMDIYGRSAVIWYVDDYHLTKAPAGAVVGHSGQRGQGVRWGQETGWGRHGRQKVGGTYFPWLGCW